MTRALEVLRSLVPWDLADRDVLETLGWALLESAYSPVELAAALRLLVREGVLGAEVLVLANSVLGAVERLETAQRLGVALGEHLERCALHGPHVPDVALGPKLAARRGGGRGAFSVCSWRVLPDPLVTLVAERRGLCVLEHAALVVTLDGRRLVRGVVSWPSLAPALENLLEREDSGGFTSP